MGLLPLLCLFRLKKAGSLLSNPHPAVSFLNCLFLLSSHETPSHCNVFNIRLINLNQWCLILLQCQSYDQPYNFGIHKERVRFLDTVNVNHVISCCHHKKAMNQRRNSCNHVGKKECLKLQNRHDIKQILINCTISKGCILFKDSCFYFLQLAVTLPQQLAIHAALSPSLQLHLYVQQIISQIQMCNGKLCLREEVCSCPLMSVFIVAGVKHTTGLQMPYCTYRCGDCPHPKHVQRVRLLWRSCARVDDGPLYEKMILLRAICSAECQLCNYELHCCSVTSCA